MITLSPHPHPFQSGGDFGWAEADGFAEFEVGDDSGDAPVEMEDGKNKG